MTDAKALPGAIEAAWGLRGRPTRGPKPLLSGPQIVAAAVRVAAAEGFGAVSMARVATELSTSAMSLYRHVANKEELAVLMIEAVTTEPVAPRASDESWRPAAERYATGMLAMFRANPWVLQVPISTPPATPRQLAWLETGLAALDGTGLTEPEMMSAVLLVIGFVRNDATLASQISAGADAQGSSTDEVMSDYGALLRVLVQADRFPVLRRLVEAGVVDRPDDPDTEFQFGLTRILDGIAALIDERAGSPVRGRSKNR